MNAYVNRDDTAGRAPKVLNIEELATIWHFPVATSVRAPLVQTAPGRKAEAPMGLPRSAESERGASPEESVPSFFTEEEGSVEREEEREEGKAKKRPREAEKSVGPAEARPEDPEDRDTSAGGPPGNLPTI